MHVRAVADDFRRDLPGLQHGAGQTRRAMIERRHAVEEMRRLPCARCDRRGRLFEARARMPERDAVAARGQPANQLQPALQLRRERDDPDVRRPAFDLAQDVVGGEPAPRGASLYSCGVRL